MIKTADQMMQKKTIFAKTFTIMFQRKYYHEELNLYIKYIPPDIVEQYNLNEIAINGKVYVEIRKGMYGLPQAGILAN